MATITIHDIPERSKMKFKMKCLSNGKTMKEEICEFIELCIANREPKGVKKK